MATLEAITLELQNLNGFSDLQLDTTLEQNERIAELTTQSNRSNELLSEILEVLQDFMNFVPEQIVRGFEPIIQQMETRTEETTRIIEQGVKDQIELAQTQEKLREREEEISEQKKTKKPVKEKGSIAGAFAKGKSEYEDKSLFDLIDGILPITAIVASLGSAFAVVGTVMSSLSAALVPIGLIVGGVIAVVNGVMNAFESFNNQEGDLGDKLLAGIRGFLTGIVEVITWPFDYLKNLLADGLESLFPGNEVTKFLDSFSYLNMFRDFFNMLATLFEDMFELLDDIGVTDAISNGFNAVASFIGDLVEGLGNIVNYVFGAINKVRSFIGMEPLQDSSQVNVVALDDDQQDAAIESARQSKLYNKNVIGESEVDESKLKAATTNQLQAIVNDDDLSAEQRKMVVNELQERQEVAKETQTATETQTNRLTTNQSQDLISTTNENVETVLSPQGVTSPSIVRTDVAPSSSVINTITTPAPLLTTESSNQNISVSNERGAMTNVMMNEQNKLSSSKTEMASTGGTTATVVDASNKSTVVNNKTINAGPIPSALDRSDRTDRRGRFRGRYI